MVERNIQEEKPKKGLGFSEFGAGIPVFMSSMCLRNAELPDSCTRCVECCPQAALQVEASGKIVQSEACVRCGICTEICPVTAISMTRMTIQELNRHLLDASLKGARLVLTCERTRALARVEAMDARGTGGDNKNDLHEILDAAAKDDVLQYVPCFGMMAPEVWFSLLNEIGQYVLEQVDMLLPSGQCTECPANKGGIAEDCFERALSVAEQWTNQSVGLLFDGASLVKSFPSFLTPLKEFTSDDHEVARREVFSETFKSLRTAWTTAVKAAEAAKVPTATAQQEAAIKRNRREAYQKTVLARQGAGGPKGRTQLSDGLQAASDSQTDNFQVGARPHDDADAQAGTHSQSSQPSVLPRMASVNSRQRSMASSRIVPKRYLLIEALGRNPVNASRVELTISKTKQECCIGCSRCIQACTPQARTLNANQKAEVNTVVCLGCKRCEKVCQKKAVEMTTVLGSEFLL